MDAEVNWSTVFQGVLTACVIGMGAMVIAHEREIHRSQERYEPAAVLRAEAREMERRLDARIDALPPPDVQRRLTEHERQLREIMAHISGHEHDDEDN